MSASRRLVPASPRAAPLGPVGGAGDRLYVPGPGHRNDELNILDQVLRGHLPRVQDDGGLPSGIETLPDLGQFRLDDSVQCTCVAEDGLELGHRLAQFRHFLFEVGPAQPGQTGQLHVQDVLRLHLAELERRRHQPLTGFTPAIRRPDSGDYGVDHVEGLQKAFDDVRPGLRPAQAVLGATGYHLDLVGHVGFQRRLQVERPRPAVDQRHHVDAKTGL